MRNLHPLRGAAAAALAAALAAGCSGLMPPRTSAPSDPDTRWESDARSAGLEVPPDLSRSGVQDAYPVPGARPREAVLPPVEGLRIERDGRLRWLVAEAEPAELWPGVRDFWRRQGFSLDTDDSQLGIIETGWAEKRVPLPVGGMRRMFERFKRFAYTYSVRDRFRTRIERGAEPGITEIHVAHHGAHEEARGDSYAWTPRPSDPDLELEMLGRLMHFLAQGGDAPDGGPAVAAAGEGRAAGRRAEVVDDPAGGKHIRLDEGFDRSWGLVRRALDRAGFTLNDLDRSRGWFLVRYIDADAVVEEKRGWFRRMFRRGRSRKELPEDVVFRIVLERGDGAQGRPTRVVVRSADGARDVGETATRLLTVLAERIG